MTKKACEAILGVKILPKGAVGLNHVAMEQYSFHYCQ
jgi:hypothetical protein